MISKTLNFLRLKHVACNTGSKLSTLARNRKLILGIETSCDDTGVAVVDDTGRVLGEALRSQTKVHLETGGIIPSVARDLHKNNIEDAVNETLHNAEIKIQDVDAIAVTVKPGLVICLHVGVQYAKQLAALSRKPLIPIHHMEAHALTARMMHKIDFPFLVLLASGGHCLLAVAREVDQFLLLGKGIDIAPGDCLDKTARKLNLKNHPKCRGLSGGAAIEMMSRGGNSTAFDIPVVSTGGLNCNFSFSGLLTFFNHIVELEMQKQGLKEDDLLSNIEDCCASFQFGVLRHIARRLQRAFTFCQFNNLLPQSGIKLVLSGGVGSNQVFRKGLERLCSEHNAELICPPPKLCTDNGIMIAWNGMEKLLRNKHLSSSDDLRPQARCPLGEDWTQEVHDNHIKLPKHKYLDEQLLDVIK